MAEPQARIHYHRPPSRTDLFEQWVVQRSAKCIVTFMPATPLTRPVRVEGETILEPGSPVVWFTYPGRMHDVGIFHDAAGRFTGYYANILTPVIFHSPLEWETTDLFLDIWVDRTGRGMLLDEEELAGALANGWLDQATAAAARGEADRLLRAAALGEFPPADVRAWSLARVRQARTGRERHA